MLSLRHRLVDIDRPLKLDVAEQRLQACLSLALVDIAGSVPLRAQLRVTLFDDAPNQFSAKRQRIFERRLRQIAEFRNILLAKIDFNRYSQVTTPCFSLFRKTRF